MSYLNTPRLTFSGQFQADPSTVNNDPTHFNNNGFQQNFQQYSSATDPNGWWNPDGTGNWRFIGCTITSVTYQDGTSTSDPLVDPIIGSMVMDTDKRTAAKLVDLDSQQQMVSEIWGLVVRLVAKDGTVLLKGDYKVAPFTNIWFNRSVDLQTDSAAGAIYQSVIQNLEWNITTFNSRYLTELQATCNNSSLYQNQLSINFNVDRYNGDNMSPQFTLGRIAGAIGPSLLNEPDHFVLGRQFFPAPQQGAVNYGAGAYDTSSKTFVLDLGNSLQCSTGGVINETRDLRLAVVTDNANNPTYTEIGKINYHASDWYMGQAGICAFTIASDNLKLLLQKNPLAVVQAVSTNADVFSAPVTTTYTPVLYESTPYVRADKFVFRLDNYPSPQTCSINFYATNLGQPLSKQTVQIQDDTIGTKAIPGTLVGNNVNQPAMNGIPAYSINVGTPPITYFANLNGQPAITGQTDFNGMVTFTFPSNNPGMPRSFPASSDPNAPVSYIDGQVYGLSYNLPGQTFSTDCNQSNFISILMYSGAPTDPPPISWSVVQPIFQQYANLYPLMSKGIFNLADQKTVDHHAQILLTAFSKPIGDPNYMPATRDLSAYKLSLITQYLQKALNP